MTIAREKVQSNSHHIQALQTKYNTLDRSLKNEEEELKYIIFIEDILNVVLIRMKEAEIANQYSKLEEMKINEFGKYPDDLESLEAKMEELQSKASAIYCNNPNVLNEYQTAQRELRKHEKALSEKTKKLTNVVNQMEYDKVTIKYN